MADNKKREFQELITALTRAFSAIENRLAVMVAHGPEEQRSFAAAEEQTLITISDRIFIQEEVVRLLILKRWQDAVSKVFRTRNLEAFSKEVGEMKGNFVYELPVVRKDQQHRPTVTADDVKEILSKTRKRMYLVLFALLAATGLRIGEALGLKASDFCPDCCVLHISRSIWRGKEQEPKTANAVRVVDIPEVLASELRQYVSEARGYLFATSHGRPLQQRNVLRVLHQMRPVGFHAFRRFRVNLAQKNKHSERPRTLLDGTRAGRNRGPVLKTERRRMLSEGMDRTSRPRLSVGPVGLQNEVKVGTKKVA